VRALPLLGVFWLVGCTPAPRVALERAQARLAKGGVRDAVRELDAIAARRDATPAERTEALTTAALASDRLGDAAGARRRLERAIEHEVPGVTESALFYLAERLRVEDRGRALNLYYRAAAGAEKHRSGGFPYQAAMDRILQLSVSSP
jgi:hypothetical protein